ncbi:MAG TPA: acetyl-CoA carboxylase biotin carboxyl carrier protein [Steroidobacteraceae bacterium]|nr:acetyl-CoA carboxylase biotin carboxyl carrier protein [Steroidobacteraceae bacterium]
MNLTRTDVEEILKLLDASPYDELELETDRFKLTLRRAAAPSSGWTQTSETKSSAQAGKATAQPAASAAMARADDGTVPVRAPLIGTFYRAPKPGAPPCVEVGSTVSHETVVGIVETMKLMNSVNAGTAGVVTAIEAADGEFVEQDHVLMRVRPAR